MKNRVVKVTFCGIQKNRSLRSFDEMINKGRFTPEGVKLTFGCLLTVNFKYQLHFGDDIVLISADLLTKSMLEDLKQTAVRESKNT